MQAELGNCEQEGMLDCPCYEKWVGEYNRNGMASVLECLSPAFVLYANVVMEKEE